MTRRTAATGDVALEYVDILRGDLRRAYQRSLGVAMHSLRFGDSRAAVAALDRMRVHQQRLRALAVVEERLTAGEEW